MTQRACVQAVWAELMVDALAESGVSIVVLSPGSRSTPLVLALLRDARLQVVDVIDERSAGFVALGVGRSTGTPAVLVCTSGSAPAHYFPAVVEADAASVPLIVLSSNRPFALQHAGESQTVDQTKLYGDRVRFFADLGEPSPLLDDLRAMRRVVAQAVQSARAGGPAHLDARFVKPLEPPTRDEVEDAEDADDGDNGDSARVRDFARQLVARGVPQFHEPLRRASDLGIQSVADALLHAARPIVVVGPLPSTAPSILASLREFQRALHVPVFVDAASNARFASGTDTFFLGLDALYRSEFARRELAPDLIVQVGRSPVATGFAKLMSETEARIVSVDAEHYLDPHSRASDVLWGDVSDALVRLAAHVRGVLGRAPNEAAWFLKIERAERIARASADELLAECGDTLSEAAVARMLTLVMPSHGRLLLGNSLSIRNVDGWALGKSELAVDSQRGASGIDGLVAGVVGASLATNSPNALLLGDVSFAHDVGSVALLRHVTAPTLVVVVDNGGGRIFEQLPVARSAPEAMAHFVTEPGIDIVRVVQAMGVEACACDTVSGFREAAGFAMRADARATLIVCRVSPHGASTLNAQLWARVDARLRREGLP